MPSPGTQPDRAAKLRASMASKVNRLRLIVVAWLRPGMLGSKTDIIELIEKKTNDHKDKDISERIDRKVSPLYYEIEDRKDVSEAYNGFSSTVDIPSRVGDVGKPDDTTTSPEVSGGKKKVEDIVESMLSGDIEGSQGGLHSNETSGSSLTARRIDKNYKTRLK